MNNPMCDAIVAGLEKHGVSAVVVRCQWEDTAAWHAWRVDIKRPGKDDDIVAVTQALYLGDAAAYRAKHYKSAASVVRAYLKANP